MSKIKKRLTFAYGLRSFLGYQEGRSKADHTINSYCYDLLTFEKFLHEKNRGKVIELKKLVLADLERYSQWLTANGYRSNSKRRKILTVRRWFTYLNKRKQLKGNISAHLAAPLKSERIPRTIEIKDFIASLRQLIESQPQLQRQCLLAWILAETGCLVSEVIQIRRKNFTTGKGAQVTLAVPDKNLQSREVQLSSELGEMSNQYLQMLALSPEQFIFAGHNRFGPFTDRMTERGVEMTLKNLGLKLGLEQLTPRLLRHSCIVHALKSGKSEEDMKLQLGLKSDYAFRVYRPMIAASV